MFQSGIQLLDDMELVYDDGHIRQDLMHSIPIWNPDVHGHAFDALLGREELQSLFDNGLAPLRKDIQNQPVLHISEHGSVVTAKMILIDTQYGWGMNYILCGK